MHLLSRVIEVSTNKSAPIHTTLLLVVSRGTEANFFPPSIQKGLFPKDDHYKRDVFNCDHKTSNYKKVKWWWGNGAFFFWSKAKLSTLPSLRWIYCCCFMTHSQSSKYTHHYNTLQQVSKGWSRCFGVGFEEYWCHPTSHEVSMRPWHFVDQSLCAASSGKQLTYGRKQRVYIFQKGPKLFLTLSAVYTIVSFHYYYFYFFYKVLLIC